ncbi:MAG: UDP-3-O-acyl-N-acetylglucosamine deacetylase [Acidobacteria bacterium]|nr:UDP-3-O-acyl-N-acetylglucosamine deacetylase [Acidobacteriota bacterium]
MKQTTIRKEVKFSGVGLHTGADVSITLKPAPENTGYIFVRTDLDNFEIPASVEYISLAALRGSGVDNCFIELDNIELPIMDGSSEIFIDAIRQSGMIEQKSPRHFLRVLKHVAFEDGDRHMSIEPSEKFWIECAIDFPHPFIKLQSFIFEMKNGSFCSEIASARTFGFVREIEMLRKANLALGGSLDNAVVLTDHGMLNESPLRYADEFVRHKILDIIGDFALLGMLVLGKITAMKTGHAVHAQLMGKLLRTEGAWEIVECSHAVQSGV